MSVPITLTEEQAKWLRDHLNVIIVDGAWKSGPLNGNPDATEHAQTIRDKIKRILEEREWEAPR